MCVKAANGLLQAVAFDEAHRIERPAVGVDAHAVDGHDAWVLQAARDLGFEQEARAVISQIGVLCLDLLEGDLAVQLLVVGDEDFAQPAAGVRPQDAKTASF